MVWYNFLKEGGYFNPIENPEPIQGKEGIDVPYWKVLDYLEKLSVEIKEGRETSLIEDILFIIKDVSEHPKDNYKTWYVFIKILDNIPNEKISKEILNFIPIWISGTHDTMLQSSELCQNLLPKFLSENPTHEDVEKAELIIHHLFKVEKNNGDKVSGNIKSYYSRVHLYYLSRAFEKGELFNKIVYYCSYDFIFELGRTIKMLLLDYPKGVNSQIKDEEKLYQIKITIESKDLHVFIKTDLDGIFTDYEIIQNFESLEENDLKQILIELLKSKSINYLPTDEYSDTFEGLKFVLNNDLISSLGSNAIGKLDDIRNRNGEDVLNIFAVVFRNLLVNKAKEDPNSINSVLRTLCHNNEYKIPFFKRVALYVISKNWSTTQEIFWELIDNNDSLQLFSKYKYQKEIYEVLNKNQQLLVGKEIKILEDIIEQGPQDEINLNEEKHTEYWQLRWYSALKDINYFKTKYLLLSNLLNITYEHYEDSNRLQFSKGSISPISSDKILELSNQQIVDFLISFKPTKGWKEPNTSGLADALTTAVENEPQKFSDEIDLYFEVPYIYMFNILYALCESWKKEKVFNWEKVIVFCLSYVKRDNTHLDKLQLENDTWKVTYDSTVGAMAYLLSNGMKDDKKSFDIKLIPSVKEIILIIVPKISNGKFNVGDMHYPTYSYNSTSGKVLRALLDYSLFRARHIVNIEAEERWEQEIRISFEGAMKKGIVDTYILQGMYFEQLYYLDKTWITNQVKQNYSIIDTEWRSFIGGLAFANAPSTKDIYELFYSHYERAIEYNVELDNMHDHGLLMHLVAFYFWGYEDLKSQKLIFKLLNESTYGNISKFINIVARQETYAKDLSEAEKKEFELNILVLWKYLVEKYRNTEVKEEGNILADLTEFIIFVPELDDNFTLVIVESCKYIDQNHYTHRFLEKLVGLKNKGNPINTAKSISEIIFTLQYKENISEVDQNYLINLVSFLFKNGQEEIAKKFCNKMASNQRLFLRDVYNENV